MATRKQTVGSTAIQYEDFKPNSEWEEEEGANILRLNLPDFRKEQMKVTYVHTTRVIKVNGETPITDDKWKRFDQSFSVPQNCNVKNIQGKFQNGVLTITMPKITITPPPVPSKSAPASADKEGNQKKETPLQMPQESKTEQNGQKGIKETSEQKETDGKKLEPQAPSPKEPMRDTVMQNDEKGDHQKITGKKGRIEGDEKTSDEQALFDQQEENIRKRKESVLADQSEESSKKRKEAEKDKEDITKGATAEEKGKEELLGEKVKNVTATAMKKVKGLAMDMNEEGQSLANIGAAVLVIAALGAYIYYSYGSSGNSKD